MTPREQLEELEILAEELTLAGEPPITCGIRCESCGVELILPWADREGLIGGMEGHASACPMPPRAA